MKFFLILLNGKSDKKLKIKYKQQGLKFIEKVGDKVSNIMSKNLMKIIARVRGTREYWEIVK